MSADRLALLAEALAAYPYEWNVRTGRVERASDFSALLGLAPEEVEADAGWWQRRIHPDDLAGPIEATRVAWANPEARGAKVEYRVRHQDGSWRWMLDRSVYVRDGAGQVERVVGITADVTEERVRQEALVRAIAAADAAGAEIRSLLDRIADGYVSVDQNWRITHVNAATARINQTTPEALIGRNAWEVWDATLGTRFETELRASMADGQSRTFVEFYAAGAARDAGVWIENRVYPSPDGLSVFFRDVTEEYLARQAERAAHETAERSAAWMRTVSALSAAVNDAPTTDAVLDVVVRGVRDTLQTDLATLLLLDENGETLRVAASAGLEAQVAARVRVPVGKGFEGRVAATRSPVVIDDVVATDFVSPYLHAAARSVVGVPLIGEGRVLGVLHTASRTPRVFTSEDVTLLELVSARAASAFLRARVLEDERSARGHQAERLQALSADLTRVLTRTEVTNVVVRHLVEALGAHAGGVVELSEDGSEFVLLATVGFDEATRARYARYPVDTPIPVRDVARDRTPVFLESRAAWLAQYDRAPALPVGETDGAWVALPLLVEDRLLGALTVSLRTPRSFPVRERRFMQAFADLCAQALERARLYDVEHTARGRAEALQHVTAALAAAQFPTDVGRLFTREIASLLGADTAWAGMLTPDGSAVEVLGWTGFDDESAAQWHRLPVDDSNALSDAVRAGRPQWWENKAALEAAYPHRAAIIRAANQEAVAIVPLLGGGTMLAPENPAQHSTNATHVVGVMSVGFHSPRQFDRDARAFVLALAQQCGQALVRATANIAEHAAQRRADDARVRAEQLQALTAALARTLTAQEVAEATVNEAGRAVGAISGTITLLDDDGGHFTLLPWPGMPADVSAEWRRFPNIGTSPAATAVRTLQPCYSPTRADFLARNPAFAAIVDRVGIEANVAVPLAVNVGTHAQRVFGALTFAFGTPRTFGSDEDAFLRAAADQCAQALDRARLFDAERRARREADVSRERADRLRALTAALGGARTPDEVAATIAREGMRLLGAKGAGVGLLEAGDTRFRFSQLLGSGPEAAAQWETFPNERTIPYGEVVATRRVLCMSSNAMVAERFPRIAANLASRRLEALVVLPLVGGGETVLGAAHLAFPSTHDFGAAELREFEDLAQECGQALERARLLEAEHRERERAEALQALAAALARAATPEEVAKAAVTRGMEATGTIHGVLSLLDADGTTFTLVAAPGVPEELVVAWRRYPNAGDIPAAVAVRTGSPVYSRTRAAYVARSPGLAEIAEQCGIEAEAVLPLRADGRTLGTISFAFAAPREFEAADDGFLKAVSDLVATALDRAYLYAAERAARADAEAARAAAEAANRAKMDFLATMSHELRTPLNAIGGYTDLLSLGVRGPVTAQQQEDLARIQKNQQHLLGLINEVLNFARLESGAVQYDLEEVRLGAFLGGLEALVLPQVRARGLTLTFEPCDAALHVLADAEKLRQILLNLLSNALKFTPTGGELSVKATLSPGALADAPSIVRIAVRDTGVGVPPEQLDTIFEPFVQVGRSLSNPGEGTGLGLAISRDLARGMGGDLIVVSTPGAGSTFTLTLPVAG